MEPASAAENSNLFSVVKQKNERKTDQDRGHNRGSFEDILGSLSASKPLYGNHMTST